MQQLICRGAQGEIPGISPLLAPLLIARGADTYEKAQAFLHPSEGDLNDPFLMPDMRAACDMVRAAIARRTPIAVYGDYDCDGVCASVIMLEALRSLGADARSYIPSRKDEGYGRRAPAGRALRAADHGGLRRDGCAGDCPGQEPGHAGDPDRSPYPARRASAGGRGAASAVRRLSLPRSVRRGHCL